MSRAERSRALVVSALLVVAVAVPGLRMLADPEAGDGYPLSTIPMFAEDHGRTLELQTVVAVTDDGVERLSPHAVARGAWVVVLGRGWRTAWDAAAWAFHVGVLALMAIVLVYPLSGAAFAPFFRLERLAAAAVATAGRRRPRPETDQGLAITSPGGESNP